MPPRRTRKPRAAKARGGASRNNSGGLGWLWLLGGTALGAVIAVALFFHDQPKPDRSVDSAPTSQQKRDKAADTNIDAERHFGDIYERLDSKTAKAVTAPSTRPTHTEQTAATPTPAPSAPVVSKPAPSPPLVSSPAANKVPATTTAASTRTTWWLQAGAFRSAGQADALKARLTLTGLPVKVVSGRGGKNILWYRVRVGPYRDKQRLNSARQRLKQQKISPVLIKQ